MAGPFKMKAGKEGPMKKNFGISPMKQDNDKPDTRQRGVVERLKQKAINEAKQVGSYVKTLLTTPRATQGGNPHGEAKKAYNKTEKKHRKKYPNLRYEKFGESSKPGIEKRYRDYVKKSNKNPKKYPPKSQDSF